jgi:hypothetical protein
MQAFRLTVFIVAVILTSLLFLLLFFYKPVKAFIFRHNVSKVFYSRVMKLAKYNDFYLINDLKIKVGGEDFVTIDHVLGGDKFIYLITDCYFEGALSAKREDQNWIYYKKGGKKERILNPLFTNAKAVDHLSIASGINSSFLVGIVLVNDDCFVTPFDNVEGSSFFTPLSKLKDVIAAFEKKDVKPFVKEELWQTIHDLYDLSDKNNEPNK